MFGANLNPIQSFPVTVITPSLVIQGNVRTRLQRLTDVLNEPDMDHLILYEASFMEVGSRRLIAEAGVSQVSLTDMLFVHMNGPVTSNSEMRTPKQPTRATLLTAPYTIEGMIHLPFEEEINQALDGLVSRFVPVTGARYWAYGVAESPNYVDLLVVNRVRSHIALPVDVEWHRPSGGGADMGRGQNPW